ncbi:hypothetical protein GCM10027168_46710 [Streptomyces capparidis]
MTRTGPPAPAPARVRPAPRRVAAPLLALAACAAALPAVAAALPTASARFPPCPLPGLTGLYCPGCGGLRATLALAHGDPVAAAGLNAAALAAFAALAALWVRWLARTACGRPAPVRFRPPLIWAAAAAAAAFTVVRNLPFGAVLAP